MTREECYSILGIASGSDAGTIRAAYKRMAKKWHPDINPHPSAKETFQQIQTAYSLLLKSYLPMETLIRKAEVVQQQQTDPREAIRQKREALRKRLLEQRERERARMRELYIQQMHKMLQKKNLLRYRIIYLFNLFFIGISLCMTTLLTISGLYFIGFPVIFYIILLFIGIGIPNYFAWHYVLEFSFLLRGKLLPKHILHHEKR